MDIQQLHRATLEFLLSKNILFITRKNNKNNRLSDRFWFLGESTYMNVSFWEGYDTLRRINKIGFAIDFNAKKEIYLILSSKSDPEDGIVLGRLAIEIGAQKKASEHLWIKTYRNNAKKKEDWLQELKIFINSDKTTIDKFLEKNQSNISFIKVSRFEKWINNINKYRSNDEQIYLPLVSKQPERIYKTKRKGINQKNIEVEIREIISKKIKVYSQHSKLQNRLKSELEISHENINLILEQDYIDISQKTKSGHLILYEVKPYKSVIKCIREGIGQLLFYCSQREENLDEITLIIAGPSEPNDFESEFIRFVKKNLGIKFEYKEIKLLNNNG